MLKARRHAVDDFQARRVRTVPRTNVCAELYRHGTRRGGCLRQGRNLCTTGGAARREGGALQPIPYAGVVKGMVATLNLGHGVVVRKQSSQADAAAVIPRPSAVARRRRSRMTATRVGGGCAARILPPPDDRDAPQSPVERRRRRIPSSVINALSVLDLVQGARSPVQEHGQRLLAKVPDAREGRPK